MSKSTPKSDTTIVRQGLKVLGSLLRLAGDTPTKKAGTALAGYGAFNLDLITVAAGGALRFHDRIDSLTAKTKALLTNEKKAREALETVKVMVKTGELPKSKSKPESDTPKVDKHVMVGGMQYQAQLLPEHTQGVVKAALELAEHNMANDAPTAQDIALIELQKHLGL